MTSAPLLNYTVYQRQVGIRNVLELVYPRYIPISKFSLPLNSNLHYMSVDGIEDGPSTSSTTFFFRYNTKPILAHHITEQTSLHGNPRHMATIAPSAIRAYHAANKRMRIIKDIKSGLRDPLSLTLINYSILSKAYIYPRNIFSAYNRWYNIFSTFISKLTEVCNLSDRQNFIITALPKTLPSAMQLDAASLVMNQTALKTFKDKESFLLLEVWKWLGDSREKSLLSKIPANKLHLVNIIIQDDTRWFNLNLGILNSMRDNPAASGDGQGYYYKPATTVMPGRQLQRRYLMLQLNVAQTRAAILTKNATETETVLDDNEDIDTGIIDNADNDTDDAGAQIVQVNTSSDITEVITENETVPEVIEDTVLSEDMPNVDVSILDDPERLKQHLAEEDAIIDKNLETLNEIATMRDEAKHSETSVSAILKEKELDYEAALIAMCEDAAISDSITAAEYKRLKNLAGAYRRIPSPFTDESLSDFITITPEQLKLEPRKKQIKDMAGVPDKNMLANPLGQYEEMYATKILQKDIAAAVVSFQRAGVAVIGYRCEKVTNVLGSYLSYAIEVQPMEGTKSTIRVKLPLVEKDGTFKANGVAYRLRKQRRDLPIRKVSPTKVSLTSYYGKVFVNRGRKKSNDYTYWITTKVMENSLEKNPVITKLVTSDSFYADLDAPRAYSALSTRYSSVNCHGYDIILDKLVQEKNFPQEILKEYETDGSIVLGFNGTDYLVIDRNNFIYKTSPVGLQEFGSIELLLGLPGGSSPVEYAELGVFGKDIPIGFALAYSMGLEGLMAALGVKPRRVAAGGRLNLLSNEYSLVFNDETLIFNKDDKLATIILGGFLEYHRAIKLYSVHSFEQRGAYVNLLESAGMSVRYLRELDLMYKCFIDPVTLDLLRGMKQPETFKGLLIKASELLLTDSHEDEFDPEGQRIVGYERFSGAVYTALIQAYRVHNAKLAKKNSGLEVSPYAVWRTVVEDTSKIQVSELNPVEYLKSMQAVTFSGTGGRNRRSMMKRHRSYHENNKGTIGEATVDNSDVAINVFTSHAPQLVSLRGISGKFDKKEMSTPELLSTSAVLSAGATRDDPKRIGFISIQYSHYIPSSGTHQEIIRTGAEKTIGHMTSDMYACSATKSGVVKSINEYGIIIDYDDGEVQGYTLGIRHGAAAGLTIPHEIKTQLKVGDTVNPGDYIVYNPGFFEPDFFNKKDLAFKTGAYVTTCFLEGNITLEDSSGITQNLADKLRTKISVIKSVVVLFDKEVQRIQMPGSKVEAETVLCYILDQSSANASILTEQSIDTLRVAGSQTPRANLKAHIDKIEVFYYGDKEDMSSTLREITEYSDGILKKQAKATNRDVQTGSIDGDFRINNEPLIYNSAAIRFYMTETVDAGPGDKGVFFHQMKSVFGDVITKPYVTESGVVIDAVFGRKSIDNRTVRSPDVVGTTATLLEIIGDKAAAMYLEE